MENKAPVPDKQNPKRPVGSTALTAAVLGLIALVFTAINLWDSASPLLADARIGQAILALEAGVTPLTQVPATEPPQTEQTPPRTSAATVETTAVYPPTAANSPQGDSAISPARPNDAENVITTLITASPGQGYLEFGDIYIKNNTAYSPDIEGLLQQPLTFSEAPTVLIIHTHATECYTPTELDSYEVSEGDRCTDPGFSVVRVGDELTDALRAQGIRVIHDRTLFDGESYTGAYARSNAAVRAWLKKDPSIAVVLDIHRDALNAEGSTRYRLALETASGDAAQMLILVGTDGSGANHPNWQSNLSLGLKLQRGLNEIAPGIVRPMLLTNGSYDQEVCPGALLIEVGANGNSLSDALVSAGYLGEVLGNILK
ncbi:MAG: hypothetical protein E7460_04700 [Ruminococcaceae bacterium]|nr:hypothetical protein [Oscillospiraceae bacterium]